jgi:hypothetical protein
MNVHLLAEFLGVRHDVSFGVDLGVRQSDCSQEGKKSFGLLPVTKWGRLNLSEISHVLDCPRVVGLKRLKGLLYERSIQQLVERDVDFRADYVGCLGHCGLGVARRGEKRKTFMETTSEKSALSV